MRGVPKYTAAVRHVPGAHGPRDGHNILRITHHPHRLHSHHHVRKQMAVDQPHTGVGDTHSPASPARDPAGVDGILPSVEHGCVALDGAVTQLRNLRVVLVGVVLALAAANVIVVPTVSMYRVRLDDATRLAAELGANVLEDDLEDLANLSRERHGPRIPPVVLLGSLETRDGFLPALVDIDESRCLVGGLCPRQVSELPAQPPYLVVPQ